MLEIRKNHLSKASYYDIFEYKRRAPDRNVFDDDYLKMSLAIMKDIC